jgi:hypothetical protein
MQRVDTSRRRRPAGDGPVRGHKQRAPLCSIGTPSARRITTLAPAFGQALPTLGTVPTEYNHEVNAELLYDLCSALVKEGLGSPETWQQCRENAVVFALRNAFHRDELQFHGSLLPLAEPRAFAAWLRVLFRHDWVVYSKRPFGGPEHVLRYLGAYTHRVAISNSRLVALSDGNVTFRWRDSAHGNKKRLMTLALDEFLRRFLLHLLPPGFVRIRNFGFLANRNRASLLPLCFQLLNGSEQMTASAASPSTDQTHSLWNCPVCGGTMRVVERLSAAQLLIRSPPQPDRCAA